MSMQAALCRLLIVAAPGCAGVYVEEGSDRDSLTAALSKEGYIPVYLDEKTVSLIAWIALRRFTVSSVFP